MEEEKLKKIVSLVTIAVVVIFFAMLVGLVFQFISISKLKAEKKADYIGDIFFTDIDDEVIEENEDTDESGDDNEQ